MRETRKRGFVIKPEGLALIEKTMKEKGYSSREKLAEAAEYLSIDTVNRLFRGERTQRKTIEAIAKALDLKPTDLVDPSEWFPASSIAAQEKTAASEINIGWREVCHTMLKEQQDKQRLRRQATEMGFEVNVHVPLGLVERKQQQRRDGNVELNQLYQLDQEVIAKTYQHDEFLTEVIGQRQARKNKHIAIVGEPGAGKTTLLGAIASFIQSNTEDLPICITLASLQGRTLEDYLLKTWLSEAMGLVNPEVVITPEIENELIKQFRKGEVWLLLDGVDEMGADSPVQALTTIQKQLTNWVGQARVVLTCRLNIWDVSVNNTLTGFDTYRTQEFTHEQIDQFIQEWFSCAEDAQRGEQLQTKLKEPGRKRILELVKHPLRLALLCQTFYLDKSGDLPETKAALYERFTRYFYEWKHSLHPKNFVNQDELHQALGKLALAGINSTARFRLRQNFACEEMGELLFKLANDLGWLNLVDRDAGTDEPVYAFFHPTFQEYFAALAIYDWNYFLPQEHDNQNPKPVGVTYRIFEPQWKEVILLWIGREDVSRHEKEAFIEMLVEFNDGCNDYYKFQSFLIAATGIGEFRYCQQRDKISGQLINFSLGYFDEEKQQWMQPLTWNIAGATEVLKETKPKTAIAFLVRLIQTAKDEEICRRAAEMLGEIDLGNRFAITTLVQLIQTTQDKSTRQEAANSLNKIDRGNEIASAFRGQTSKISVDHLTGRIEISLFDKEPSRLFWRNESTIHTDQVEIASLLQKIQISRNEVTRNLIETNKKANKNISDFADLICTILRAVTYARLMVVGTGNEMVINTLLHLIQTTQEIDTCMFAAITLMRILQPRQLPQVVTLLKNYLTKQIYENSSYRYQISCNVLWYCAQNMTYSDFYQAWHSQLSSYPEAFDNIPVGNSPTVETLENQFTDRASQVQPTDKTYPIVINAQALEGETDTSAIAQALSNRIYRFVFPDDSEIPPEVSNAYQLERSLLQLKKQLQKQSLALILDKCEPNQSQVTFCRKLTDVLHIAWITNQPLEPPLKGFPREQANLLNAIQSWIDEIG